MGNKHIQELSQHYQLRCYSAGGLGGGKCARIFVGWRVGWRFLIDFQYFWMMILSVEKSFFLIIKHPSWDQGKVKDTCHFFPSLPFPSLPFPSLPFPSLPFPSLPFPSLPFPSLPFELRFLRAKPCGSKLGVGGFWTGRKLAKSIECYC